MRDVQARAGEFGDLHVARDADGFRGGGHSGKTEAGGGEALAHGGAGGE